MNTVILIGNLGKDPEIKYFDSGACKTTFTLALSAYNSKTKENETEWVNCEAWNKTAETIAEYCKKGHKLCVTGSLKTQKWEDENGNKKSKTIVLVHRIEMLTPKNKEPQNPDFGYEEQEQGKLDIEDTQIPQEEYPF